MPQAVRSALVSALVAVALAACPGDGGDDPDAAPGPAGLELDWRTAADVPGPLDATRRVQELAIQFSSVRAIGDAAPGDPRTSRGEVALVWGDRDPSPVIFDQAPAGLYSRLELGVGGSPEAFELHGEVRLGATWTPFEVEDESPIAITVPTSLTVDAGERAIITITLDLAVVLAPIDFTQLPSSGGVLHLTRTDPQMGAVRTALAAAFVADPGGLAIQ